MKQQNRNPLFLVILPLFCFFLYVFTTCSISTPRLDKLIAVAYILYYSSIHIYYGLFICLFMIVYVFYFKRTIEREIEKHNDMATDGDDEEEEGFYIPSKEDTDDTVNKSEVWVINLEKNKKRMADITENYQQTDMSILPLHRFEAINGKKVDIYTYLTPYAVGELQGVEKLQYRTKHYQLTKGGVGCFLSHYELAKQLLEAPTNNPKTPITPITPITTKPQNTPTTSTQQYIVLEDDAKIGKSSFQKIQYYIKNAPDDWDILLFGYFRMNRNKDFRNTLFHKPNGFWGTHGYVINKKGAQKLVDEVDNNKIDGQIDSYLSRMIQQNKINIYASKEQVIELNGANSSITNIQTNLRIVEGVDPFDYFGYQL